MLARIISKLKALYIYNYYSNRVTEIITQPMFANIALFRLAAPLRSKTNII